MSQYDKRRLIEKSVNQRNYGEEYLDSRLETVWLKKGYSKNSVKEYVSHLLKELDYQKESFEAQLREIFEENKKLVNDKGRLSKQLDDSLIALSNTKFEDEKIVDLQNVIKNLHQDIAELKNDTSIAFVEKLKRQINEANEYSSLLNKQLIEEKTKNKPVPPEYPEELIEKVKFYKNENETLKEELANLLAKENSTSSYYDNIIANNAELEEKVKLLTSQLEDYNKTVSENQALNTEVLSLKEQVKNLILKTEKHDQIKKTDEQSEIELKLASTLETLNELKDKVELLQSSNDILTRHLEEQRTKNREILSLSDNKNISVEKTKSKSTYTEEELFEGI